MADLREDKSHLNESKSINLALSERGIDALHRTGYDDLLEAILESTIPMHSRMIHTRSSGQLKSESQAYDIHGRFLRSVDRNELNALLLDKLEAMPNVTLHFRQKLTGADFDAKKAWFEDLASRRPFSAENPSRRAPEHEVDFDLMIGADGAHSAVRFHLMKFAHMDFTQSYIDCVWCEFTMTAQPETPFEGGYQISPNHLHIWPAGSSMFIALPTHDGKFVCTLFGTHTLFKQLSKSNEEDFLSTFDSIFPGVTKHIPPQSLLNQFRSNPHLPLINIKCTPHHYSSSVVILGDAANAMVPFYGQGMNAGLESVRTLFDTIDNLKTTQSRQGAGFSDDTSQDVDSQDPDICLAAILEQYTQVRVQDTHAICDLALGNYHEMASGVVSKRYKWRKWVEETLDSWLPILDWKTQYSRVSFEKERYSTVIAKTSRQGRILNRLIDTIGVGAAGGVAFFIYRYTRFGRQ